MRLARRLLSLATHEANLRSYQGLVFSAAISPLPFAFQSPRSCSPSIRANSRLLPFRANDVGKWGKSLASCTEQSEHPGEPLWLRSWLVCKSSQLYANINNDRVCLLKTPKAAKSLEFRDGPP